MTGVSGGGFNSGGDSKYQGYDNRNYGGKTSNNEKVFGQGVMNTAYGDYNYSKSTLDKYKDK